MRTLYVIVERNEAGQPRVDSYSGGGGDIYDTRSEALEILDCTRQEMKSVGRPDTYALATLVIEEGV